MIKRIFKYQGGTSNGGVQINGHSLNYDWNNPDTVPSLPQENPEASVYNSIFTPDVKNRLYQAYSRNYKTLSPYQRKEFYGMLVPSDTESFIPWIGEDKKYKRSLPDSNSGAINTLRGILGNLNTDQEDKLLHTDWSDIKGMTSALGFKNSAKLLPYIGQLAKFRMGTGGAIKKRF